MLPPPVLSPPILPAPRLEPAAAGWWRGRLLPWLIIGAYRLLAATWRIEWRGEEVLSAALAEGPVVFACWHGEQLPLVHAHRNRGFVAMVSQSRDGELLARVLDAFGYGLLRGSSSRGGVAALLGAVRAIRGGQSIVFAVDGPRGPLHDVKPGALLLAASARRPILYCVSRVSPAGSLGSWDRFVVPAPFARVRIAYGRMDVGGQNGEAAMALETRALRTKMEALAVELAP